MRIITQLSNSHLAVSDSDAAHDLGGSSNERESLHLKPH